MVPWGWCITNWSFSKQWYSFWFALNLLLELEVCISMNSGGLCTKFKRTQTGCHIEKVTYNSMWPFATLIAAMWCVLYVLLQRWLLWLRSEDLCCGRLGLGLVARLWHPEVRSVCSSFNLNKCAHKLNQETFKMRVSADPHKRFYNTFMSLWSWLKVF